MPTITKISQQKHDGQRYNIEVDGQFAFALSANDLLASGVYGGLELTDQQLEQIRISAGLGKAYDQALNYISLRRRSEKEIFDYLKRKDYDLNVVTATVERLISNGMLNDIEFARAWVVDRNRLRPRSMSMLRKELSQKGLSSEVIDNVLSEIGAATELDNAVKIVQKKLTRYSDQPKLIAYLMRQGYSYLVVKQALEQASSDD